MNTLIDLHGASVRIIDVENLAMSTYALVELGIQLSKLKAPIFVYDINTAKN
jgi:hypothetical protein